MKRFLKMFGTGFVVICVVMLCSFRCFAADDVSTNIGLNGTPKELSVSRSGYWNFSTPSKGKIDVTITSYGDFYFGFILWGKDAIVHDTFQMSSVGSEEKPVTETFTFSVMESQYYSLRLHNSGENVSRAVVSITFTEASKVSNIALNHSELKLESGESINLSATVTPQDAGNKELEWSSSDESVAIVNQSGAVYTRGAGLTTIYAKAKDGSNVEATCKIIVIPSKVTDLSNSDGEGTTQKKIVLQWDEVAGADGYLVYKYNKNKKKYVLYKDVKSAKATVKGLSKEKSYKFKVSAYVVISGDKVEGAKSNQLKAWTAPKKVSAPKITSITTYKTTSQYNYIKVKWKKSKGATRYLVYGGTKGKKYAKRITDVKGCSVKLMAGRGYTYTVIIVPVRVKHGLATVGKSSLSKDYRSR